MPRLLIVSNRLPVTVRLAEGTVVIERSAGGLATGMKGHKGRVVSEVLTRAEPDTLLLAMGDDRTDEDLFAALPAGSIAIHVGAAASRAPIRIVDVIAARALLAQLGEEPWPRPSRDQACPDQATLTGLWDRPGKRAQDNHRK